MSCADCNHLEDGACTRIYVDQGVMVLWDDTRTCSLDVFMPKSDFHCRFYEDTEPRFWHAGGLGFPEWFEPKPIKWEYLIWHRPGAWNNEQLDGLLNTYGRNGWELVQLGSSGGDWHQAIFKRRKMSPGDKEGDCCE